MGEKDTSTGKLSRRDFLRTGASFASSLCLLGLAGCSSQRDGPAAPVTEIEGKGLVRPVRALWFTELEGLRVRCQLCPRQCELENGSRGRCRVRENRDGELYSLAYGNPALVQEDPVERKPYFHVSPGSRALSISTAGCNLACKFCEVWDMALVAPEEVYAHDMPPQAVVDHALDSGVRALSYAFGEPVIFYEYMAEVAVLAKEAGLLNLLHTAGYIRPQPLQEISPLMDAANVDLKGFDPDFYREVVGGELEPVLNTLRLLKGQGVHLEVTNILIPTLNDDDETLRRMCQWIAEELGDDVPLHFARFYPLYKLSALPRTPVAALDRARSIALEVGLKFVYVARVTGHVGENTFCPECDQLIIERVGFVIEKMHLEAGRCRYCGANIPGAWG